MSLPIPGIGGQVGRVTGRNVSRVVSPYQDAKHLGVLHEWALIGE